LKQMGLDFRVAFSSEEGLDKLIVSVLTQVLDCRFVGFGPNVNRMATAFPCDFGTELPNAVLLSDAFGCLRSDFTKGVRSVTSPYGEAGRLLHADDIAFVAERVCLGTSSRPADTSELASIGMKVGLLPNLLAHFLEAGGDSVFTSTNDHLDRVAGMLKDPAGGKHLIIDPMYWGGPASSPITPAAVREKIKQKCNRLGVTLHLPFEQTLSIPYSLNFVQFDDGRVMMTSGDEPLAKLIVEIVGDDKVVTTATPIFMYPTARFAGIRCLVGQVPTIFFKKHTGDPVNNWTPLRTPTVPVLIHKFPSKFFKINLNLKTSSKAGFI